MKNEIKLRSDIPQFLQRHLLNKRICEVGVRFAYNFQQLLSANPDLAVAVDHWHIGRSIGEQDTGLEQGKLDKIYLDVVMRYIDEPCVKILRARSDEAAGRFPLMYFDYVYLDADHTHAGCLRDIRSWWPRVRQGGIIAGHDYTDTTSRNGATFGVIQAVDDFMAEKGIDKNLLHITDAGFRSWMLFKQDGE
jgi:hypothetical protein